MDILGQLFGSEARVKLMRLFLLNPNEPFESSELRERTKSKSAEVRKELAMLTRVALIEKKDFIKEEVTEQKGKSKTVEKRAVGWQLRRDFPLLVTLGNFLINGQTLNSNNLGECFSKTGKIKLLIASGIFIERDDSRADILIVGDNLKKKAIENVVKTLESEIGKELSYAFFETKDFLYRVHMYDKFVRDVLDFPHEKVVNKIGTF